MNCYELGIKCSSIIKSAVPGPKPITVATSTPMAAPVAKPNIQVDTPRLEQARQGAETALRGVGNKARDLWNSAGNEISSMKADWNKYVVPSATATPGTSAPTTTQTPEYAAAEKRINNQQNDLASNDPDKIRSAYREGNINAVRAPLAEMVTGNKQEQGMTQALGAASRKWLGANQDVNPYKK